MTDSSKHSQTRPRHVLITGANGQLGSEWVQALQRKGIPYTAFGSSELDITDAKQVKEKVGAAAPDLIINAAAYTHVDLAETEKEKAFAVNATGVANLAEAAKKAGALLVHYSTDYVFPGTLSDRKRWPGGYPTDAPVRPVNTYGESKCKGEEWLAASGASWLLIRVSWLCSARGKNFIKTVRRVCRERGAMSIVHDQFGSPTYTSDVVNKTLALVAYGCLGTFHVASKGEISWYDFGCEIAKQSGITADIRPIPSKEYPTPAPRPSFSLLDCSKTENLGLPQVPWKDGLREIIHQIEHQTEESI